MPTTEDCGCRKCGHPDDELSVNGQFDIEYTTLRDGMLVISDRRNRGDAIVTVREWDC